MSSRKENEGHLIQRVNRYVSVLGKCPVVKLCTKLEATLLHILAWFVMRWQVEVTFEEVTFEEAASGSDL